MPKFFMPIASAFAPNYTLRDVLIAGKYLMPWNGRNLQDGNNIAELEENFCQYMDVQKAVSFESGRAGFYAILKAMEIKEQDEIILQAFTTVALPNTIKLFGAKPVFVDILEKTYDIDPDKIEEMITPRTKAIVIQHTFGQPADMDRILALAEKHNLKTVEDCAHSLGAKYKQVKTGKFADAAFFSFGRDKVISSVMGGMVITKNTELADKIEVIRNEMPFPSRKAVRKNLLHPVITFKALHTYNFFSIGKALMFLSFRFKLLNKAYTNKEKKGESAKDFARRMPNALAAIALNQLRLVGRFNRIRIKASQRYAKHIKNNRITLPEVPADTRNIFLWYTIMVDDKKRFISEAAKHDMILGDWFPQPVGPKEVELAKAGYRKGSCPVAEKISAHCVNLPTHHNIHLKETQKVIEFVNSYK